MECFIKKVWQGKGEETHNYFVRFGKGKFKDKAMIKASRSGNKFNISTTPEYTNELVRGIAEKLVDKTKVRGVIVSTRDLDGEELDYQDKKQFIGVKQYCIDKELSKEEIIEICNKFPKCFIALSFKTDATELNIKPKSPKSAKPNVKGNDKPKIDFCKLKTTDENLVRDLIFEEEAKNFKKIEIKHTFIINELVIPDELKEEKDFTKIREKAKRKGKIIRELNIDGKIINEEKEFEA